MKRISDAILTGQTVANNMMTLAEKRQGLADAKKKAESIQAIQTISTEPEDVQQPASPEMQSAYKADRQGRLEAAFAGVFRPKNANSFWWNDAAQNPRFIALGLFRDMVVSGDIQIETT